MDGADFSRAINPWSGEQVRFMTAGSVDDGKSTLIGRMLLDSQILKRDQTLAIGAGDEPDLASLTDGLEAERAQGITIDVAYRYFATPRTSFIIADAPGHEQYTRNMVTAASVSDVAVVVIDATQVVDGVLKAQTRRHAAIASLMGLDIIVAVNKMDLTGWSEARFNEVRAAFEALAIELKARVAGFLPVSAKVGDNVVSRGAADWYAGPTLVELLERTPARASLAAKALRLPVQVVLRDGDSRHYAGRIEAGVVRPGDTVRVGPSAQAATVSSVRIGGVAAPSAQAGASVSVTLSEQRDLGPGDVIAAADVRYTNRIRADLCWLDQTPWSPARRYRLRQGALETQAKITNVSFVRNIETFGQELAQELQLNDIAHVDVTARDPLLADLYAEHPGTGAFVLFDLDTNQTAAAGMIREIAP